MKGTTWLEKLLSLTTPVANKKLGTTGVKFKSVSWENER